jgi:hypothetical protein
MTGLFEEIGPFQYLPGGVPKANPYAWTQLATVVFIDQPVGTGLATKQAGVITDESQLAEEFYGFLLNVSFEVLSYRARLRSVSVLWSLFGTSYKRTVYHGRELRRQVLPVFALNSDHVAELIYSLLYPIHLASRALCLPC